MAAINKGDVITADFLNELDRVERRLVLESRRRGPTTVPNTFIGEITTTGPNGEADYTDSRYWIKAVYISNTGSDPNAKVTLDDFDSGNPIYQVITATNFSEYVDDTHGMAAGTPVFIHQDSDLSENPKPMFWFEHGGAASAKGQYMGQANMETSQNQSGFVFPFAHAML